MQIAREKIADLYVSEWGDTLVVTSTTDGRHRKDSKHYDTPHNAEDYRLPLELKHFLAMTRAGLGKDYDVVLESDHLHVEYDPK